MRTGLAVVAASALAKACQVEHCTSCSSFNTCEACEEGWIASKDKSACMYKCVSDVTLPSSDMTKKGLALDDTTFRYCPDNMPVHWPNTNEPISTVRMFKAWQPNWPQEQKVAAWQSVASYAKLTGAKFLIGTEISCNETYDDEDWKDVKGLMEVLGARHISAVAVGNELELLCFKTPEELGPNYTEADKDQCLTRMWNNGYALEKFHERIDDLSTMGGEFADIPITSVFGGYILASEPFVENTEAPKAMVNTFMQNVTTTYGDRFIFTLNIYPYFDPGMNMDPGSNTTCENCLAVALCFDTPDPYKCLFTANIATMRDRMRQLFGDVQKANSATFWVTETGWSSPKAQTLNTGVAPCAKWSEKQTMMTYYSNFLKWNMSIAGDYDGPDLTFYFTMRDSGNFGEMEGFGLVGDGEQAQWCSNSTCKLQSIFLDSGLGNAVVV